MLVFIIIMLITLAISFVVWQSSATQKMSTDKAAEKGALFSGNYKHCTGLPIAEDIDCTLYAFSDKLVLSASGADFAINFDKVTDIQYLSEKDVQHIVHSSVSGAIAGSLLFGTLGAIIGGRAKTKTQTSYSYYLIITYKNTNDELAVMALECLNNISFPEKFIQEFRDNHKKETITIEL